MSDGAQVRHLEAAKPIGTPLDNEGSRVMLLRRGERRGRGGERVAQVETEITSGQEGKWEER